MLRGRVVGSSKGPGGEGPAKLRGSSRRGLLQPLRAALGLRLPTGSESIGSSQRENEGQVEAQQVVPMFLTRFFFGWEGALLKWSEKSWYPYSNFSAGGPS